MDSRNLSQPAPGAAIPEPPEPPSLPADAFGAAVSRAVSRNRSRTTWDDPASEAIARRLADLRVASGAVPSVPGRGAVLAVRVHSRAALRRREAVLEALQSEDPGGPLDAIGEASLGIVALYLAVAAAQTYTATTGESASVGARDLAALRRSVGHMRDLVMHWDEKSARDAATAIQVTDADVLVVAPHRRAGPTAAAGISWDWFRDAAHRLATWAAIVLDEMDAPPPAEA